jgi:hypothetical protein
LRGRSFADAQREVASSNFSVELRAAQTPLAVTTLEYVANGAYVVTTPLTRAERFALHVLVDSYVHLLNEDVVVSVLILIRACL